MAEDTQKQPVAKTKSATVKVIPKQDGVVYVDGFDDALIGHGHQQGTPDVLAVYSIPKAVEHYMAEKNLTKEEAQQELITKYINTKFAHRCPLWGGLES